MMPGGRIHNTPFRSGLLSATARKGNQIASGNRVMCWANAFKHKSYIIIFLLG